MSSHHFVKEGQEPALFIFEAFPFDRAASLLEWSPLVIVADHVVDAVLRWGIKIDVVLQQQYPLEKLEEMLLDQSPVQIVPCGSAQTLEKGLDFLVERKYRAVNILTELGPHFFDQAGKFSGRLQLVAFTKNEKCSLISSGKFEKWMEEGSKLKIFQDSEPLIQVKGLIKTETEWVVQHSKLVSVESKSFFWVGEPG
jgi:hypothetical protein